MTVTKLCFMVRCTESVVVIRSYRQNLFFFSSQSLAHCLAAATTPLCAFVTVATNSKARERCFIAVDVNVRRAGLPSNSYVTHICGRSQTNNTH